MPPSITAVVPMRDESERVPGKNYRLFNGLPLYHHIVMALLKCPEISSILIDTDSETILEDAATHFPSVHRYVRPVHLRDGATSMNKVLVNSIEQLPADFYLQTHSTNPLLRSETIGKAIRKFEQGLPEFDSLFSVTRLQTRLWDQNCKPINHDPLHLMRTQDLPPVFEENSCIFLFSKKSLELCGNRIGNRPIMFEIDRLEAQDIDTETDFTLAETLARSLEHGETT